MEQTQKVYEKIEDIVGTKYVSDSKPVCYSYSMNCDTVLQGIPDVVVRPGTSEEVANILSLANETGIKIIPRGGGADLTGGAKPIGNGGVVIDLTRMNSILDIDEENLIVTTEAGISWSELCEQLSKVGIGYYTGTTGPGSGFSATIGGGLSNNSVGGGGAAMYGAVTEQCVGLEVALPTGELIYTGSKANTFCNKPFTRFGLGPDYSGLFLGDVGLHGIKTKASFRLYPIPEYAAYNTYEIRNTSEIKEYVKATNLMMKWQNSKVPIHDFYYYTRKYAAYLKGVRLVQGWANQKIKGSVIFYTTVGNTQKELDHRVERIEKMAKEMEIRELGPSVEEGNLAKWFYNENGRWQWAHIYWGLVGPDTTSCGTCLKCRTNQLPQYVELYEEFNKINSKKLLSLGNASADFVVFGVYPNYLDVTGGLSFTTNRENRALQEELWKDLLTMQIKELGAVHYWMGEIIGRVLVDSGALTEEYYNFMVTIKKALDPNGVMSPGKFYLTENYNMVK